MPGKHAKSGGARAVAKKHAERAAERGPEYRERAVARAKRLLGRFRGDASAETILDEAMAVLRFVYREALTDKGMPPEQAREQAARAAAAAIKAADPKKLLDERAAIIREQQEDIAELEARVRNAPQEHPLGHRGAPTTPEH